jgi:hypothetical protein
VNTKTALAGWFKIPGLQNGKVDLNRQGSGLDVVWQACAGATVLDLGCAEGLVALEAAGAGARLIHGVELIGDRLQVAEALFAERYPGIERQFITWDLTRFDELFLDVTPDSQPDKPSLLTRYDAVLCLAIAQKLFNPGRFLRLASALCTDIMAVRLPYPVIDDPRSFNIPVDVTRMLSKEFELIQETEGYPSDVSRRYQPGDEAWLGIFRRRPAGKGAGGA